MTSKTPTAAMEAAQKVEVACTHPLIDAPARKDRGACRECIAAALVAYAAERIAHVFQERGEHGGQGKGHPAAAEVMPYLTVMEQRDAALAKLTRLQAERDAIVDAARRVGNALEVARQDRDAALARAEAAEAEVMNIQRQAAVQVEGYRLRTEAAEAELREAKVLGGTLIQKVQAAEERVRVLEAVLRHEIPWRDYKTKYGTVSIDANGAISIKAAAAGGGKDEPASAS